MKHERVKWTLRLGDRFTTSYWEGRLGPVLLAVYPKSYGDGLSSYWTMQVRCGDTTIVGGATSWRDSPRSAKRRATFLARRLMNDMFKDAQGKLREDWKLDPLPEHRA